MSFTPPEKTSQLSDEHHIETGTTESPSVQLDKEAERRLRTKIDWAIIPTVSIVYLMCFIDRANIGKYNYASSWFLEREWCRGKR